MLKRLAAIAVLCLGLPACATITTGTSHNLTILTTPPGAACEIRRGGEVVGAVNPTPGSVRISKSGREMQITCNRAGMEQAQLAVAPGFQAATLGNILLGGLVGIVVDGATGAAATYPSSVTLAMAPPGGGSAALEAVRNIDARIEALRSICAPAERARCEEQIRSLEAERVRAGQPVS